MTFLKRMEKMNMEEICKRQENKNIFSYMSWSKR